MVANNYECIVIFRMKKRNGRVGGDCYRSLISSESNRSDIDRLC